jgi:hypothetical protein
VTVTPAVSQTGTAEITVTVTDADGGAASESFLLTVNSAQPLEFVSSYLADWLPAFTNHNQTNLVEWIDTSVTTNKLRFYRAVQ